MKNLLALIWGLIFFASCSDSNAPENLIDKNKMANVLIDMHLADASLDYKYNQDSMLMYAKSKYNYLFNKHKIDSSAFSSSLKYYSNDNSVFGEIYKNVKDSLSRINKPEVVKIQRFKRSIPDSLRFGTAKIKSVKKDSLVGKSKKVDSLAIAKKDSLSKTSNKRYALLKQKPVTAIKDTTKSKEVVIKPLDRYLIKTDSLNTVKLLGIGIDF